MQSSRGRSRNSTVVGLASVRTMRASAESSSFSSRSMACESGRSPLRGLAGWSDSSWSWEGAASGFCAAWSGLSSAPPGRICEATIPIEMAAQIATAFSKYDIANSSFLTWQNRLPTSSGPFFRGREPMRRRRTSRSKGLRLAEFGPGSESPARGVDGRLHEARENVRVDRHPGVDDQVEFPDGTVRRQRKFGNVVAADEIGNAEEAFPQADRLQMRRFGPRSVELADQPLHDGHQQFVHLNIGFGGDADAGIEPAQLGLALGIDIVVDVEHAPAEVAFLLQQGQQRLATGTGAGRDLQDGPARTMLFDQRRQLFDFVRLDLVDTIDENGVGLFELFFENIGGLRGEADPRFVAQDARPVAGLEDDAVGRNAEFGVKQPLDRLHHRRHEVSAASDRLGENDVGPARVAQRLDGSHQSGEIATEARPGHFTDVETLRAESIGIDEICGLVVGDDADVETPRGVVPGEARESRCLPCTQKTSHHDEPDAMRHRSRLRSRGCVRLHRWATMKCRYNTPTCHLWTVKLDTDLPLSIDVNWH